ncbi:hypothetical protein [Micromonospora haikouensis]|uniref:hypothetical protein n=1 Tax=Micromonospora haikouensis TaxID=686309 RepID=UPI003D758E86
MIIATYAFQPVDGIPGPQQTCHTLLDDAGLLADQLAAGAPDGHYITVWMSPTAVGRPDAVAYSGRLAPTTCSQHPTRILAAA